MAKFLALLIRTSVSSTHVEVDADNAKEAHDKVLEIAGDQEFTDTDDYEYEVYHVKEILDNQH